MSIVALLNMLYVLNATRFTHTTTVFTQKQMDRSQQYAVVMLNIHITLIVPVESLVIQTF